MIRNFFIGLGCLLFLQIAQAQDTIPATGISGVYEVVLGTAQATPAIRYFREFGFRVVDSAQLTAVQSIQLYGVPVGATVYRLQNGSIDSHGLLRIIVWDKLLGPGVGYAEPETVGQRIYHSRVWNHRSSYPLANQ